MNKDSMFVRELKAENIELLIQCCFKDDEAFWLGIGVDVAKIPLYEL